MSKSRLVFESDDISAIKEFKNYDPSLSELFYAFISILDTFGYNRKITEDFIIEESYELMKNRGKEI